MPEGSLGERDREARRQDIAADAQDAQAQAADAAAGIRDREADARDRFAEIQEDDPFAMHTGPADFSARIHAQQDRQNAAQDRVRASDDRTSSQQQRHRARGDRGAANDAVARLKDLLFRTEDDAEAAWVIAKAQGMIMTARGKDPMQALLELATRAVRDRCELQDAARSIMAEVAQYTAAPTS